MTRQVIGIGAAPNDGTGDPLRTAMTKVNANTLELYETLWRAAGSWTFSINVTEVDFTGLGIFSEIMVLARGITKGTTGLIGLRVSSNAGVSFYSASGDYQILASTGIETAGTMLTGHLTNATAARTAIFRLHNFNKALIKPCEVPVAATTAIITQAAVMDAVRILPSGGGNLTGGTILIYGR